MLLEFLLQLLEVILQDYVLQVGCSGDRGTVGHEIDDQLSVGLLDVRVSVQYTDCSLHEQILGHLINCALLLADHMDGGFLNGFIELLVRFEHSLRRLPIFGVPKPIIAVLLELL